MATMTEQRLPPGAVATVLDRERTIVARTHRDAETVGSKLPAEVAAAMQDGAGMVPFAYASLDGPRVVAAYAQAPQTGYWAQIIVPAETFEAPLRAALLRTAAIGGALLAASLLLGATLATRLAASLRQLADPARTAFVTWSPEFNALAGSLTSRAARYDQMAADLRALFDGSPVGVVRSDAGGRVRDANDAFLGIVGMTRADLAAGRVRWDDLTPPEWIGRDEAAIAEAVGLGGCAPYQKEYVRPDGSRVPVLMFFAFTDAATGAAAAFVVDLSGWVGTEAALARAHEQMRLAIGAARMFFWDWDLATGRVEWSDGLEAACGLPPGGFGGTVEAFRALMHPDDLPRVEVELGRSLAGEAPYDTEFRMCRPDGSLRWVVARGTVQRDGTGRPVRLVGIDLDVTDRKAAEATLVESEARLWLAQESAGIGFWDRDLASGTTTGSPAYFQLYGLPPDAPMPDFAAWLALVHPEDRDRAAATAEAGLAAGAYQDEFRILRPDGTPRWVAASGRVQRDAAGQPARFLGVNIDITERKTTELSLRASEERFRSYAEASPDVIYIFDMATGRLEFLSPAFERIWGEPRAPIMEDIGHWAAMLHPEDRAAAEATMQRLHGGEAVDSVYRIIRPSDGEERHIRDTAVPIRDAGGRLVRVAGLARDVSSRIRTEQRLAESEAQLRKAVGELEAIQGAVPIGLGLVDREYRFRNVNPTLAAIDGLPAEAHINRTVAEVLPELWPVLEPLYRAVLEEGRSFTGIPISGRVAPAAEEGHWLASYHPVRDVAGAIWAVSVVVEEITAQRRTAAALIESEARLQRALDEIAALYGTVPVGLGVVDHEFRYRHINAALAGMNGQPAEAHIGRTIAEVMPALWPKVEASFRAALERGEQSIDLPISGRTAGLAEKRHWLGSYHPVRDMAGAVWGVGIVVQDVTERQRAAADLAASEARFRSLAETLPDFVFVTGADGQITYVNARVAEYVGRPAAALLGEGWAAVMHPEDRAHNFAAWQTAVATGTPFEAEYRFLRHDGAARWFLCRGLQERDAGGRILRWVGTCTDIDDLRQAEGALRQAEERLSLAIEGATIGTCSWDLRTNLVQVSPRMCHLYGLPEAPTVTAERFLDAIHPEDRPQMDAALASALSALSKRVDFHADHRVILPDGSICWRRSHGRGVFGPDGAALALHGVVLDIDAEKQAAAALQLDKVKLEALVAERTHTLTLAAAELTTEMRRREEAQAALVEAQKLEALGQLTGGVAHDFNNVLAAVMGSLRLIERRAAGNAQIIELARAGNSAADRAAALIRQLMAFARREDRVPVPVTPAMMLREARDLLQRGVGTGVRMEVLAEPDTWPVLVDPHRLEVALLNLAANARDAMAGSGTLAVTVRNVTAQATEERPLGMPEGGDHVVFGVRDSGPGMPPEVLARATEAFFTTKPRGQGTGLGLAMVRSFVQDSSGAMRMASTPGEGTLVELWLPRAVDAVPAPADPDDQEDLALHGDATVLVVDDDPAVRLMTVLMLRDLGYEVLEAGSADAAIIQALAAVRLDVVVSDITMPGGDGPELIARLRADRPGVPTVFVSGYADRYPQEAETVLAKPFTPAQLGSRVLRALGRVRPRDRLLDKLRRPELREAYVVWRRLMNDTGGVLPAADAFDVAALSGAANAFRVAVGTTGAEPAFQVQSMGSALTAGVVQSFLATNIEIGPGADELLGGLADVDGRCARFDVPCHDFARYELGDDAGPVLFERLILPFADAGASAPTHLVGIAYLTGVA